MSAVYRALSDPTRRTIIGLLRARDMSAGELAEHFPQSKPTLSKHFAVLKSADLIQGRRQGTTIYYTLNVSVLEEAICALLTAFDIRPSLYHAKEASMSLPNDRVPEVETTAESRRPFRVTLVASLALLAVSLGLSIYAWQQLPADARLPIHWNVAGQVDGYASRASLFMLPAALLGLTVLLVLLPSIEPRRGNLLRSSKAYSAVWIATLTFLAVIHAATVMAALGRAVAMDRLACAGAGLLFLVIGNYLGKVRSNFFFGVRTPWTLESELSWNKTNRLAGRLFIGAGLALLVAIIAQASGPVLCGILFGSLGITAVTAMIYSYLVWRRDPHKGTTGA